MQLPRAPKATEEAKVVRVSALLQSFSVQRLSLDAVGLEQPVVSILQSGLAHKSELRRFNSER